MGRSTDEAGELLAAYRERSGTLDPLRRMLATPADRFTRHEEDRPSNDELVAEVVDELLPVAKRTRQWMKWAAKQVHHARRQIDTADEASLKKALTETAELRDAANELADAAVPVLDVGQRAALARHMISEQGHADDVWGPHAVQEGAPAPSTKPSRSGLVIVYTKLDGLVDDQLAYLRSKARTRRLGQTAPATEGVPEWLQRPIPYVLVRPTHRFKRRWRDLYQPMHAVGNFRRMIDADFQQVQQAHEHVVTQRRRAQLEAEQLRRSREQETQARQLAETVQRLEEQARDLAERIEAFRRGWTLSSKQLRARGWEATLLRHLTDGVRDQEGDLVVRGLDREQARNVLALLQLASDHDERTGARLEELLAVEDDLLDNRARLHEATTQLRTEVEMPAEVASLHPDLRRASEWLAHHVAEVHPVLAADAAEADRLRDAVQQVHRPAGE